MRKAFETAAGRRVNETIVGSAPSALDGQSPHAFAAVVESRRSAYSYLPEAPPRHVIDEALRLAMLGPNHHKTRPWRFHVFAGDGRAQLVAAYEAAAARLGRDVARARQRALDAPVNVVVACVADTVNPKVKAWEDEFATAAAVQTFLLALAASGVGSLLTTGDLAESPEVHRLVGLEPGQGRVMTVVNVGYRDPKRRLPPRSETDLERYVRWNTAS